MSKSKVALHTECFSVSVFPGRREKSKINIGFSFDFAKKKKKKSKSLEKVAAYVKVISKSLSAQMLQLIKHPLVN